MGRIIQVSLLFNMLLIASCANKSDEQNAKDNCKEFVKNKWGHNDDFEILHTSSYKMQNSKLATENAEYDHATYVVQVVFVAESDTGGAFCYCDSEGTMLNQAEYE